MTTDQPIAPVEVTQEAWLSRFWAKVDKRGSDECWPWLGGLGSTGDGYGRFWPTPFSSRAATQIAWEIANHKPFPKGKVACHSCDNTRCVNPAHIWPGTQSENLRDCVAKGRHSATPKSACQRGHDLSGENRIPIATGGSRCRECSRIATRERTRRWRARRETGNG